MAVEKRWETAARNLLAEQILKQRDGASEVLLERLEADLDDSSRYDIVASLEELEKAGHGQFIVGRKGKKSRFAWAAAKPVQREKPAATAVAAKSLAAKSLAAKSLAAKSLAAKSLAAKPSAGRPLPAKPLADAPAAKPADEKAAKANPSNGRESSGDAAPDVASEPSSRSSTRKALVPTSRRLERPRLSSRELPEPLSQRPARAPSASLQHSFHLRPGVLVTIDLPEDVSTTEVERFCGFLKSIPFAGAAHS